MRKVELLAPAGNMDSLKAAVQAGCDAVYLGLSAFSARAFAGNFTHEEYLEAISYCHIRNVKVYVTLNTLFYESEFQRVIEEVDFLYENDVDAILIQDLGLFDYIRKCYPDLEVHCSTQMNIHNKDAVTYMMKKGASRIVLARETPLEVIEELCQEGYEIEVFVYGANCISYSGQCLMSSAMKNRSGNRGVCAQMCRLKYMPSNATKVDGEYLLSPKDTNLIEQVGTLIDIGVASFKIEGRMKRSEYVYLVVKTFREAIDAHYRGEEYHVSPLRQLQLEFLFTRGFTKGHMFHETIENRMSHYRPNHLGVTIGHVLSYEKGKVKVKLKMPLAQNDGLRILNEPVDTGLTAVRIEKNGKLVNHADEGDIVVLDCKAEPHPKKGQLLQKTTDVLLQKQIQEALKQQNRKIPISITYDFCVGQLAKLTIQCENQTISVQSEKPLETAKNAPITKERLEENLSKIKDYPYEIESFSGVIEDIFLPIQELNQLRREAYEQLSQLRSKRHSYKGKVPYQLTLQERSIPSTIVVETPYSYHNDSILCVKPTYERNPYYLKQKLPVIHESEYNNSRITNSVISELGALSCPLEHTIAGMNFNITNIYAIAFLLQEEGVDGVVLSSEIDDTQIELIQEHFLNQFGFVCPSYRYVYGRRTLMYIKDGFLTNQSQVSSIVDLHHMEYPLWRNNGTVELLEPDVYRRLNRFCQGSYIRITSESEEDSKEIIEEAYEEISKRI